MKNLVLLVLSVVSFLNLHAQETIDLQEPDSKENASQLLSLQPIVFGPYAQEGVVGIGFSYEREISAKMAWQLPLQYYFEGIGYGGFGVSPTLKLYPFGMDRTVTWSVGPALRYSLIKDISYDYDYYYEPVYNGSYQSQRSEEWASVFGFELQSGLGINIDRFNFGINSSLGLNYTQGVTGTFINTMSMGIRF